MLIIRQTKLPVTVLYKRMPGDDAEFKTIFITHYKGVFAYACMMIKNETEAEEITQTVFVKLWEKRESLSVDTSLKAYLYRAAHNDCINWLKRREVMQKFQNEKAYVMKQESDSGYDIVHFSQLEAKLGKALRELPERCRTIFQLSRFEELKYREIAAQLHISEKTVENQMGKALKILRAKLVDFLPLLFVLIRIIKKTE